ncbi:GAF domain-containing protein [Streptomyces thermocarboxydus]
MPCAAGAWCRRRGRSTRSPSRGSTRPCAAFRLARWINPDAIPDWAIPEGFSGPVGSVLVTPLPGHGVPAGALILLRSDTDKGFSPEEEVFARLFASRAGTALSAARLYGEQTAITGTLMRSCCRRR